MNADVDEELGDVIFTCLQARDEGSVPDRQQLKSRYPQFAAELDDFFANLDRVEQVTAPLRQAVLADTTVPGGPAGGSCAGGPRRFGNYELLEEIGRGGMGVVFKARQPALGRLVALKMIAGGQLAAPADRLRFRQEAETAASLDHPNIVPIHEVGEVEGQLFFTMKLVEGGNLNGRLPRFHDDPRAAAQLVAVLASAVQFAHQRGVLHRDLKPSNILLDQQQPYITDFGLAKRLPRKGQPPEESSHSGHVVGSPLYMAPEQAARARGPVTTATDVFGLGGILYALLTGRAPFQSDTLGGTLQRLLDREPVPPARLNRRVPRDLEAICLKCLHKEPVRRYATALELADDLGRFDRGEPIRARPVSAAERLRKWVRRRPALSVLLAVCAVLLGALVAVGLAYQADLSKAAAQVQAEKLALSQQQQVVERNYQAARLALLDALSREEQRQPLDASRLQPLIASNLRFYEEIHGAEAPDPLVRRDTGFAFGLAGFIQCRLGQNDVAASNLRRAVALLEEVPKEPLYRSAEAGPQGPRHEVTVYLAECYRQLGQMAQRANRPDERDQAFLQVLALCERIDQEAPDFPSAQHKLASALYELGQSAQRASCWKVAEAHYTRALEMYARVSAAHSGNDLLRRDLATIYVIAGWYYKERHQPAKAGAAFAEADKLLTALLEAHPDEATGAFSLANLCNSWAELLTEAAQPAAAQKQANRAVDLLERTLTHTTVADPGHLHNAYWQRALASEALGLWADAVRDWERVVRLGKSRPWARRMLAGALAHAGKHTRALTEIKELEANMDLETEHVWQLVRVCAQSATAAWFNSKLSPDNRAELTERYAAQAVKLLQTLYRRDHFQVPSNAERLRKEPELFPLRGRPDFQKLLAEVNGRQGPRAIGSHQ